MAVTLAQTAQTTKDPLTKGAIQTLVEVSNIFDRLPLEAIQGNAYAYNKEAALPGTAFRTVNEAYIESTGIINQSVETLSILGGDAYVDRFIEQTQSDDIGSQKAYQLEMKIRSANATYANAFFAGDVNVDPKGFDGLRKRLVGDQVLVSTVPATDAEFLDELDDLFARVATGSPDVVYAPKAVIAKLKGLGRKVGGADYVTSELTGKREFTWNGVAFVDPGNTWRDEPILTVGDPGGDLFAVRFARGFSDTGVMGITNGGLQAYDLGESIERPAHVMRVEFYAGLAVQGGQAAARLSGVKLA